MVADQLAGRGIRDADVLGAMAAVPREAFVPARYQEYAYDDGPLPIPGGQTISQPYVVALMIESLDLKDGGRALEIGTGSGYAAAVLGQVAAEVHTVERLPELVAFAAERLRALGYTNVHVHEGDGTLGWPAGAPYDGIIVAAGGPRVPRPLLDQLAIGGRLVIPVGAEQRAQRLVRIIRQGPNQYRRQALSHVRFVPLIGAEGWERDEPRWSDFY
jgi:protein-L-isoaspartate(D-aspartate) O-methyltransferase